MKREDIHKVLIIGSGPIVIGQACEFDYSGTQACKALKNLGYEIVLVNSNPATIMTDPGTADITYIEPLNVDRLEQIIEKERPDALLPNLGGQSGLNLCSELQQAGVLDKYNVKVIGVQVDAIERGEWVAIAADRTPNDALTRGDRSVTADFLGREAPFPAGPFILASLLKCGVVTLFAVREGNRILIKCEPFADEVKLPRRGREAELSRLASLWAQRLEAEALEHPAQWFNFYDFWHEEDRR